ncbi:MAG TPA: hypothetical protein VGC91_15510 [Pyrinomonadaceae bacterium]|jgi:hypothetical protein
MTLLILGCIPSASAQQASAKPDVANASARTYPKEIRGYKVERAKVEIKKPREQDKAADEASADADALIQFGEASVARLTPLGITLEIPVTVAAVKQKGHVDFLTFEDMVVNDISVTIEDYNHPFDLPTDRPTRLPQPVRLFISTTSALVGALGEWNDAKPVWPVTGRVYVFGQFKKFIFKFKRVVPVELSLTLPNPLLKLKNEKK